MEYRVFQSALWLSVSLGFAQPGYQFSTAPESTWTALFQRSQGLTGADGIFTIPLSGYEGPGQSGQGKTLFLFSDTFIGNVSPQTGARQNATSIHNSLAVLSGGQPDSSKLRFIWGQGASNAPLSVFLPNTPNGQATPGSWFWLQDGFCHGGIVYLFALLEAPDTNGPAGFKFRNAGVTLIKIPVGSDGEPDLTRQSQSDLPLFSPGVFFGAAVMPNTLEAGAPNPDGYLYVYGRLGGNLAVSRILPDQVEDSTKWTFWNGTAWSTRIADAVSLGQGGAELSVTPMPDGPLADQYLLCSAPLNGSVFLRVGTSPVGPFGAATAAYLPPESQAGQGIYTYNAKAHPNLSASGSELLISYNVNTSDWATDLAHADIYRPRFLKLKLSAVSRISPKSVNARVTQSVSQWFRLDGRNYLPGPDPVFSASFSASKANK